jgi:hypothetical protein
MSRRLRITLAVIGLLMACLSAAALAYAFVPVDKVQEQFRPAPTLFAPPPSGGLYHPGFHDLAGWPGGSLG